MKLISKGLQLFLDLAKTQAIMNRRFDRSLGGLSFSEFMILYYISIARNEKLSGVDLAEKIGLTQSGVTRLLLPMEKIGLIKREKDREDARVSYISVGVGGKQKLADALEDGEWLAKELMASIDVHTIENVSKVLDQLS